MDFLVRDTISHDGFLEFCKVLQNERNKIRCVGFTFYDLTEGNQSSPTRRVGSSRTDVLDSVRRDSPREDGPYRDVYRDNNMIDQTTCRSPSEDTPETIKRSLWERNYLIFEIR